MYRWGGVNGAKGQGLEKVWSVSEKVAHNQVIRIDEVSCLEYSNLSHEAQSACAASSRAPASMTPNTTRSCATYNTTSKQGRMRGKCVVSVADGRITAGA